MNIDELLDLMEETMEEASGLPSVSYTHLFLVKICIEDRKVLVSPIPGMFGEAENGDQV